MIDMPILYVVLLWLLLTAVMLVIGAIIVYIYLWSKPTQPVWIDTSAVASLAPGNQVEKQQTQTVNNVESLADVRARIHKSGDTKCAINSPAVRLSPPRPLQGRQIVVRYKGHLADNATSITMRVGYGFKFWSEIEDIPMTLDNDNGLWKSRLKVKGATRLNICFYDNSECWDNNDGDNWHWDLFNH